MLCAFFNVDYDALHFNTELLKINIFKVLFWEGGRGSLKRILSVYAFDNVDNSGRPLMSRRMQLRYLDVDDLVANERLQKNADETHESVLHVAVLDRLAGRDTVGDVEVDELGRKVNRL